MEDNKIDSQQNFAEEVRQGLSAKKKFLSSKYFYNEQGDALFQQIMDLPEYYLTNCEYEILDTYKYELGKQFASPEGFDLIELGTGDGKKTKLLLKAFLEKELEFTYYPTDISDNALYKLTNALAEEIPDCAVRPRQGNYEDILKGLGDWGKRKKVLLFLGSNLGNFSPARTKQFLDRISAALHPGDLLLLGLDQQKEPGRILEAYNDSQGVTAAFNLNLLQRINLELGADFELDSFLHWPLYDPVAGEMRSYLISKKEQEVEIRALEMKIQLRAWEAIHTEVSRKFNDEEVREMAATSGMAVVEVFSDSQEFFRNYLLQK